MSRLPRALCVVLLAACGSAETDGEVIRPGVDPFCYTRPKITFCEDFDTEALPGVFAAGDSEATLTLVEGDAASAPKALHVSSEAGPQAGTLVQTFDAGKKFRVFLQMKIDAWPTSAGEAELVVIELAADGLPNYRIGFGVDEQGQFRAFEFDGLETRFFPATETMELGVWTSVRLDVNFLEGAVIPPLLRFGSETAVDVIEHYVPKITYVPTLIVGLNAHGGGPWHVAYDNVTFEVD